MNTCKVIPDIEKNRLYITLYGRLSKKELTKLYTDVRFGVADLQPGFAVVTDLSECTLAALSGIPTYKKITNYLIENNVGQVIRVLKKNSLIFKQVLNFASKRAGYQVDYVSSVQEAEDTLTNLAKRDGLRFLLPEQPVKFRGDKLKGEGKILDISTSGCSIQSATDQPSVDDEISITIGYVRGKSQQGQLELKARVVRVGEKMFAAQFIDHDKETKEQLWEFLVEESKRD